MMMNVVNSHDEILLHDFFETFCSPTCETIDNTLQDEVYEFYHRPKYTRGLEPLLKSFVFCYKLFPDFIMRVNDFQITVKSNEKGSRISGNVTLVGTQLFHVPVSLPSTSTKESLKTVKQQMNGNLVQTPLSVVPFQLVDPSTSAAEIESVRTLQVDDVTLTRCEVITEFLIEGQFVYELDESHRFQTMRLIFHNFEQKVKDI
jgi:hypothetical protein